MIYEITMPSLGADMDKGRFIEWKVKVGDHVQKDQEIAVIETPKAAVELDSFRDGKIVEIIAEPEGVYPVGAVLAKMELDVAAISDKEKANRIAVPPVTEKLVEQKALDPSQVIESGSEKATEIKDVEKQLEKNPLIESFATIRQSIAKTMARSKKEIPHYYLKSKVSVDALIKVVDELNVLHSADDRLLMPAVFLHILSLALKKHPSMNGYFENETFVPKENINIGMAISLKTGGVIAPAILEMQKKDLFEINRTLKDLVSRTREGTLKTAELTDGTITVTNLGDLGCQEVFGVIFPPQVALIGIGQIRKEAVVEDNIVKAGYVVDVTLSADHRVSDGLSGSSFLQSFCGLLSAPDFLRKTSI